jgi:DNA-directed RNA polymerase subunit H (RpoH/RPB5)
MDKLSLFIVNLTDEQKETSIVHHVAKMLSRRMFINEEGQTAPLYDYNKNMKKLSDKTYLFNTNDKKKYYLKIIFQKITTVGTKTSSIEFVDEHRNDNKILVVLDFNDKVKNYCRVHNCQIFKDNFFLEDIVEQRDQPTFQILSSTDMELVKKEYNVTDKTIKGMQRTDPITYYYALKLNDIVRIIRPSPTSGTSVDYRIVR